MRLIDADKLRINCFCVDRICVDGRTIENAPTVDAIPTEWIEQYIWSADTHDEKRALRKMCIQWEKENERETDRH